jgi:hypothetical protein
MLQRPFSSHSSDLSNTQCEECRGPITFRSTQVVELKFRIYGDHQCTTHTRLPILLGRTASKDTLPQSEAPS